MIILGIIIFILLCLSAFYFFCIRTSEMYDESTNRFYRYVKDENNPHHATCKNCGELARLIHTVIGKKYYGTDCMFCHYTIWFDLWKKKKENS